MPTTTYARRRDQLETYFDRTAVDAWMRLTSTAPVGRIRSTVRAGRDAMRQVLLSWLPVDLTGRRLLDAGCGTGALATEAARRGASVVAVDLSPKLVGLATERAGDDFGTGSVEFHVGDMNDPALGEFDHVIAMDSLIHYNAPDVVNVLSGLAVRTRHSMLITFAPRTPMLSVIHSVGMLFPRSDRAPAIVPVKEQKFVRLIDTASALADWQHGRTQRVSSGFYTSQALEVRRE